MGLMIATRLLQAVLTGVATVIGKNLAKDVNFLGVPGDDLLGAVTGVAVGGGIEYVINTARGWRWFRKRTDYRAAFEGVWMQETKRIEPPEPGNDANRFAVFSI